MSEITITNEDNMKLMARYEDNYFDLAIVDPPYGIGFGAFNRTNKASDGTRIKADKYKNSDWDDGIPNEDYFKELFRVSKEQIIWGGNYFLDHLGAARCMLIWDKKNGTNPLADAEIAWTNLDRPVRRFTMHHFESGYDKKIHPTQKPVRLYEWILETFAKPTDTILDADEIYARSQRLFT